MLTDLEHINLPKRFCFRKVHFLGPFPSHNSLQQPRISGISCKWRHSLYCVQHLLTRDKIVQHNFLYAIQLGFNLYIIESVTYQTFLMPLYHPFLHTAYTLLYGFFNPPCLWGVCYLVIFVKRCFHFSCINNRSQTWVGRYVQLHFEKLGFELPEST